MNVSKNAKRYRNQCNNIFLNRRVLFLSKDKENVPIFPVRSVNLIRRNKDIYQKLHEIIMISDVTYISSEINLLAYKLHSTFDQMSHSGLLPNINEKKHIAKELPVMGKSKNKYILWNKFWMKIIPLFTCTIAITCYKSTEKKLEISGEN